MRLLRKAFLSNMRKRDELEAVVPRRYKPLFWPTMLTLSSALAGLIAWLLLASLPLKVEVEGVVLALGGIREVSPHDSGIVLLQGAKIGSDIEAGDLLYRVRNLALEVGYYEARDVYSAGLNALSQERQAVITEFEGEVARLERVHQDKMLRLDESIAVETDMRVAVDSFLDRKRAVLERETNANQVLTELVDAANEGINELTEQGIMSRRQLVQNLEHAATIDRTLSQAKLDKVQTDLDAQRLRLELIDIRDNIANLKSELSGLSNEIVNRRNNLDLKLAELDSNELTLRQSLIHSELKMWYASNIHAPYNGTVLAMNRGVGQPINKSKSVALLKLSSQEQGLMLIISPRVNQGNLTFSIDEYDIAVPFLPNLVPIQQARSLNIGLRKIMPGIGVTVEARGEDRFIIRANKSNLDILMKLQLETVSIIDENDIPVFSILTEIGDNWTPENIVNVGIVPADQAKLIQIGAIASVQPDYEPSMVGAEALGHVQTVSDFIQNSIEIEGLIGSGEMSERMFAGREGSVVVTLLERDVNGEFTWNRGPPTLPLQIGATTNSRIQIHSVSPIRIILPFLADFFEI